MMRRLEAGGPTLVNRGVGDEWNGRYWIRTSDLLGVNEARYRCAKRPCMQYDERSVPFDSLRSLWALLTA